jgi:hypothetical protein
LCCRRRWGVEAQGWQVPLASLVSISESVLSAAGATPPRWPALPGRPPCEPPRRKRRQPQTHRPVVWRPATGCPRLAVSASRWLPAEALPAHALPKPSVWPAPAAAKGLAAAASVGSAWPSLGDSPCPGSLPVSISAGASSPPLAASPRTVQARRPPRGPGCQPRHQHGDRQAARHPHRRRRRQLRPRPTPSRERRKGSSMAGRRAPARGGKVAVRLGTGQIKRSVVHDPSKQDRLRTAALKRSPGRSENSSDLTRTICVIEIA